MIKKYKFKIGYGFIYITTNNINGKRYIGQKIYNKNFKRYLGSGTAFRFALKKYGKENFTRQILEYCSNKNDLDEKEIFWIKYFNASKNKNFYNITTGGSGVLLPHQISYNRKSGEKNVLSKKVICLNDLKTYSNARECSEHYNVSLIGINECCNNHHYYIKDKESKIRYVFMFYNDYLVSTKDQIDEKIKIANSLGLGAFASRSTKVICLNDKKVYQTISEASSNYKQADVNNISKCCKNKISCAGYDNDGNKLSWMFYDDYILASEEFIQEKILKTKKVNGAKVKVVCLNDNMVFESISQASLFYNLNKKNHIHDCCKGKRSYNGRHPLTNDKLLWMYYDDYIKIEMRNDNNDY